MWEKQRERDGGRGGVGEGTEGGGGSSIGKAGALRKAESRHEGGQGSGRRGGRSGRSARAGAVMWVTAVSNYTEVVVVTQRWGHTNGMTGEFKVSRPCCVVS